MDAFDTAGWVTPAGGHRALKITDRGVSGLLEHFGIDWPPPTSPRPLKADCHG
jgi:hypothetical protein